MSKEKQIDEMADDVRRIRESYYGQADYLFAVKLYEDGYRKQIEGEWEQVCGDLGWVEMECSVCKYSDVFDDHKEFHKYCPNCGAHMRKEDEGK